MQVSAGVITPQLEQVLLRHDGGVQVFDYALLTCDELNASSHPPDGIIIGKHPLEETLLVARSDGSLIGMEPGAPEAELLADSFGAYLEKFRDDLIAGKLEWAEGWVAVG